MAESHYVAEGHYVHAANGRNVAEGHYEAAQAMVAPAAQQIIQHLYSVAPSLDAIACPPRSAASYSAWP